jgi:hypothetical protein
MKAQLGSSPVDGLNQPASASVLAQERLPVKAGESEGVSMTGFVVSFAGLPMNHGGTRCERASWSK